MDWSVSCLYSNGEMLPLCMMYDASLVFEYPTLDTSTVEFECLNREVFDYMEIYLYFQ